MSSIRPKGFRVMLHIEALQNRISVVYWNNMPSPYMVERFNQIARREVVLLEAWFSERRELDRSWTVDESTWMFRHRYLGVNSTRAAMTASRLLRANRPDVLISLYERPEYVATALKSRMAGIPVIIHAMKTFDSQRPRRLRNEIAKRLLFPQVSGFHVVGQDSANYVLRYGAKRSGLRSFPEPVDVELFGSDAAKRRREETRRRLDISGCVFLYVGRLWRHKGLDHLFEAYSEVVKVSKDVSLVLAGDGVDEADYLSMARSLPGVRFTGFVQNADLPEIYAAADVMVFPTLGDTYGHVIQEAMAASLPVVSTTAVAEVADRVLDQITGLLVPPANSQALAAVMVRLADDAELRGVMGAAGRAQIRGRTIDWWAEQFEDLVMDAVVR